MDATNHHFLKNLVNKAQIMMDWAGGTVGRTPMVRPDTWHLDPKTRKSRKW